MLVFSLLFLVTCNNFYDLTPPFIDSDVGEIGNWSLKETSTNLKHSIRLTSTLPNLKGYLCNRIPISFEDWAIHFSISLSGEETGDSFYFLFTDSFCPSFDAKITGFSLYFDIKCNKVQFISLNNEFLNKTTDATTETIDFRSISYPVTFMLTRRLNFLTVCFFNDNKYNELFFVNLNNTIINGYLTYLGQTSETNFNNIDIKEIKVYPYSNNITEMNDFLLKNNINYSKINKKKLEYNYTRRKQNKERRRQKIYPLVNKFYQEMKDNSFILNAEQRQNLSLAIKLVEEAYNRAKESITIYQLSDFINSGLDPTITVAMDKIKTQTIRLDLLKQETRSLYTTLYKTMKKIAKETEDELKMIMVQTLVAAQDLNIDTLHEQEAGKLLDKAQVPVYDSVVTLMIFAICIIETVVYVMFFISKRKYINRKYD